MEYKELETTIQHGYNNEIQLNESSRDWFDGDKFAEAEDNNELMEISPPASNKNDYDQEHIKIVSTSQYNHQQQQYTQPQTLGFGIGGQICNIAKELMFDKVVTPSDVGKLNRLVIPKQHAEKYFPLDSSSNDQKGLLLDFDDANGNTWRFRYSYWSSSQSYVMTKGWSRFVKEKKLDAGDVVSFQRGAGEAEKHHLFIDWRRRPISTLPIDSYHAQFYRSAGGGFPSWSPIVFRPPPTQVHPSINFQHLNQSSYYSGYGGGNYMNHRVAMGNGSVVYLTSPEIEMLRGRASSGGAGERKIPVVFESVPVVHGKKIVAAAAKKLRLFGVNMDCPISSDASTSDEFKILSSSSMIPDTRSPTSQYPSPSTMLKPSLTRMMHNGTSVSNNAKASMSMSMSMSLDIDI